MNIGLIVNVLSLLLVILISIIYFSKKRVNVFENKIYANILKITLLGFTINTLSFVFDIYFTELLHIRIILIKFYYVYLFALIAMLTAYMLDFTVKKDFNKLILIIYLLIVAIYYVLPIECSIMDNQVYVSGIGVIFTYFVYGMTIIFWIIHIILNYKKSENKRKFIPVILYSVGSIPMILVQYFFSELLLEPFLIAYVLIFMYHTIENPDAKILEELHKSKEISDNANEEKTLFLYNMTQEIRNITGKIDEDANIILDSKSLEVTYDSARDIKANTSKFTNMTNDILDVSNIDSSTIKVYNSKYNIKNILKQLVNVYGEICKNKELKFITNIDHDIPESLYGDAISLKEILNTILNNSVKYTEKGFVELSVNTIIKKDICRLIITVEDSGVGIKSENINKIKIDNNSLAKANKMITVMNGTILISSEYGVGTKVKVILDQKIETGDSSGVSKYESVFNDMNILCVDDSEAGLKIIDKLLKGTKINVDKAETGKECLDKIKTNKYEVILLDEDLSQITGIELMNKIKEIRNFKTPVVLLTKDNSYEYNEEYVKIGFSDYLLKPIKKEELLNKINIYVKKDKK